MIFINKTPMFLYSQFRVKIISVCLLFLLACQKNKHEDFIHVKTEEQVKDSIPTNRFIDSRDGNEYTYINIGQQVWMTDNFQSVDKF